MDRKSAFRDYFLDLFKPNFSAIVDFQGASRYEAAIKYCKDYGVSNIQILVIERTVNLNSKIILSQIVTLYLQKGLPLWFLGSKQATQSPKRKATFYETKNS